MSRSKSVTYESRRSNIDIFVPSSNNNMSQSRKLNKLELDSFIILLTNYFILKGYYNDKELNDLINKLYPNIVYTIPEYVTLLNVKFNNFGFNILRIKYEFDGLWYNVLTNRIAEDAINATGFDEQQILFLQYIYDKILTEGTSIEQSTACSLRSNLKSSMTNNAAINNLNLFIKHGWLLKRGTSLSFGPRLYADLRSSLEDDERTPICVLCHGICFANVKCKNSNCKGFVHDDCIRQFFEGKDPATVVCPSCTRSWF